MLWMSRMLWIARVAWGCCVTYCVWTGSPIVASLGRMDRFSAWTLIVLVGWGPMLFPPTVPKVAKMAWGWAASIYLPNALNALYYATGFQWPKPLYWPLALALAWGPAVFPWLARARRSLAFWGGASALRDAAGRKADWTFSDDGLEIAIDLARRELRLRAKRARWREAGGDWNVGPVEMARPLLECSLRCDATMKTVYNQTGVQGAGMTANGQPVSVFVPTGGTISQAPTGRYTLSVEHREAAWKVVGGGVFRRHDGSLSHLGTLRKESLNIGGPKLAVEMAGLPKRVGAKLAAAWGKDAAPKIAALQKSFEAELLAERKAADEDAFLRDERAARERSAFAKESANRRIEELRAGAGVGKEFVDMAHTQDGVVLWAVAADREGRAAIMDQTERWAGSLASARARVSVELAEKGTGGIPDAFELVIELDDPEFERERLAKRRFKIMRSWPREKLVAWADRIQILAAQTSAHARSELEAGE